MVQSQVQVLDKKREVALIEQFISCTYYLQYGTLNVLQSECSAHKQKVMMIIISRQDHKYRTVLYKYCTVPRARGVAWRGIGKSKIHTINWREKNKSGGLG